MTEKEIMATIEHPFLVKMRMSFQDENKLYFLLEYCPGGELFSLLALKNKITEDQYDMCDVGPSSTRHRLSLPWRNCISIMSYIVSMR